LTGLSATGFTSLNATAREGLTNGSPVCNLGSMAPSPPRLDPDRRRRRLELLAALAQAKSARESARPRRLRGIRLSELIATRRRLVN